MAACDACMAYLYHTVDTVFSIHRTYSSGGKTCSSAAYRVDRRKAAWLNGGHVDERRLLILPPRALSAPGLAICIMGVSTRLAHIHSHFVW